MSMTVSRQPVTNLGKVIAFELDGARLVRRLVMTVRAIGEEISIASPTGAKLANAQSGQEFQVSVKGTEDFLVVKVLTIADSIPQAAAV
jgi:transcription elongation GreA/GreB family factor